MHSSDYFNHFFLLFEHSVLRVLLPIQNLNFVFERAITENITKSCEVFYSPLHDLLRDCDFRETCHNVA